MAKTSIPKHEALIHQAKKLSHTITTWKDGLPHDAVKEAAETHASALTHASTLLENLHGPNAAAELERAKAQRLLTDATSLDKARKKISILLEDTIGNVESSSTYKRIQRVIATAKEEVEEGGSRGKGGFVDRLAEGALQKHKQWVSKRTPMGRFAVTNIEVLLGSIVVFHGLFKVLSAFKGEKIVQHRSENGIEVAYVPMTAKDRTVAAALGVGTIAAGIGAIALGGSASHEL